LLWFFGYGWLNNKSRKKQPAFHLPAKLRSAAIFYIYLNTKYLYDIYEKIIRRLRTENR